MNKVRLIVKIYRTIQAMKHCLKSGNVEWYDKHDATLNNISKHYLPSGSGIDAGCTINIDESNENKIVINFSFHHMDENGFYDGWTDHKVICKPSFDGFNLRITGKNKNGVKEYLYDTFDSCLNFILL